MRPQGGRHALSDLGMAEGTLRMLYLLSIPGPMLQCTERWALGAWSTADHTHLR